MLVKGSRTEDAELASMFRHQQRVVHEVGVLEAQMTRLEEQANTGRFHRLWLKSRIKLLRRRVSRVRWHQTMNSNRITRFAKQHPDYMDKQGWEQLTKMIGDKPLQ